MGEKEDRKTPMSRYFLHIVTSVLLSILFIILFSISLEKIPSFMLFSLIGALTPDIDQFLKLGHRNPLLHSFLIPFLLFLVKPKHLIFTAFSVGYLGHLIDDMSKTRQYWVIVNERIGLALLWLSAFIIIAMLFGWNPLSVLSIK